MTVDTAVVDVTDEDYEMPAAVEYLLASREARAALAYVGRHAAPPTTTETHR